MKILKRSGKNNSFYGKKHSKESKEKMRVAKIGKRNLLTSGKNHWNWKGGAYLDKKGYKLILVCGKYILEHHIVWILAHGRIPSGFVVHHKDEDKLNNKLENLELLPNGEHTRLHRSKK